MRIMISLFLLCFHLLAWTQVPNISQPIKVGVYDNPPKIFINKRGNPDGIFIDILKSISKSDHLQFEYITGNWSDLFTKLENGDIDILPDMAYSKERDSLFYFSIPVLNAWLQVFTTKESMINKLDDLQHKRIGVLKASFQENYMREDVRKRYNMDYSVITYDSYYKSVVALKKNEIDVIVASRFFYFSDLCDKDIIPTGVILHFSNLHFAFSKNTNPDLVKMFDKRITHLTNNPESAYYNSLQKWFNKKKVVIPGYVTWLIVFLSSALIVFLLFTFVLNKRVRVKTRILNEKNEELLLAKEKAEENDKLKTIFLQNMSHEIRTPMNGILGFLSLLKDSRLNDEKKNQYIDIINVSGERLLTTINDIIEISKIETNQVTLHLTEVDVNEMMNFHMKFFSEQAKQKGLVLKVTQQLPKEKSIIKTDKTLLNSILINLINNAIKFTQHGSIEFGNYLDNDCFVFYVKDTGPGIPENRREAIFERFVSADMQVPRLYEGSGLGLSIVKAYINILSGKIWLESAVGKGTAFFFSIPYKPIIDKDTSSPDA